MVTAWAQGGAPSCYSGWHTQRVLTVALPDFTHASLFKLLFSLSTAHFTSPKHRVLSKVVFHWIVSVSQDTRSVCGPLCSKVCCLYAVHALFTVWKWPEQHFVVCVGVGVLVCTVGARTVAVAAHSMRACDSSVLWDSRAVCCYKQICDKHNACSSAGFKFHCDSSQYCSHCSLLLLCIGWLKNVTACSWVNLHRRQEFKFSGKFSKFFL
jgi:hypothetical protein